MSTWIVVAGFYFSTGALLALSALLHGMFDSDKRLLAFGVVAFFWPVIVIANPGSFFRIQNEAYSTPEDRLKGLLKRIAKNDPPLSDEESTRLDRVAKTGSASIVYFPGSGKNALADFWESEIPPAAYYALHRARAALQDSEPDNGIRFSLRAPDWYVGFSNEFLKSVSGVDRKMQGRILKAISLISEAPNTVVGDTIKSLSSDLSGLWRVRIGDGRLVYYPDPEEKKITLISFGPRGSIYSKLPSTSNLTDRCR